MKSLNLFKIFCYLCVFVFLCVILNKFFTHRLYVHDFQVYYGAAKDFLNGGAVYDKYYGLPAGYYKYAPFLLFFFSIFTLVDWKDVFLLYPLLVLFFVFYPLLFQLKKLVILTGPDIGASLKQKTQLAEISVMAAIILYAQCIHRDLTIGNINLFLILLFVFYLKLSFKGSNFFGGAILGLIVMIKPHFILLLIPLFILKRYYEILTVILTALFLVLCPLPFIGLQKFIFFTNQWRSALLEHNNAQSYLNAPNTLQSLFAHLFPIYSSEHPIQFVRMVMIAVLTISILLIWIYSKYLKSLNSEFLFLLIMTFSAALIPYILLTDTEHFLYAIPFVSIGIESVLKQINGHTFSKNKMIALICSFFGLIMLSYLPKIIGFGVASYLGFFYLVLLFSLFFIQFRRSLQSNI